MVLERQMRVELIDLLLKVIRYLSTDEPLPKMTPARLRDAADDCENLIGEEERQEGKM